MSKKTLLIATIILGVTALLGWQYRVEVIEFVCGDTPPASSAELKAALQDDALILDVRLYIETRRKGADLIPQAKNIPFIRLLWNLDELPKDRTIITHCNTGPRAGKAADMLNARGFKALSGGGISNVKTVLEEMKE